MVARQLVCGFAWACVGLVTWGAALADAQPFERSPFESVSGWQINVYRATGTQAFLRCSAERRYAEQFALTIARNRTGFVLGFTSSRWAFDDGSSHPAVLRVDDGEAIQAAMRIRLLPSGPIGFCDVEPESAVLSQVVDGRGLVVQAGDVEIELDLEGAADAVDSVVRCFQSHSP